MILFTVKKWSRGWQFHKKRTLQLIKIRISIDNQWAIWPLSSTSVHDNINEKIIKVTIKYHFQYEQYNFRYLVYHDNSYLKNHWWKRVRYVVVTSSMV